MKRKLMQRVLIASAAVSLWTGISYANVSPEDMDYASKPKVVSEVAKEAMKKFLEGKFSELNQEEKNWLSQNLARHYISFDHSDNEDPMLNWDNAGATGRRSMSIGKGAFSKGVESISMGNGAGSLGDHSIALGINSRARDTHSIAIGQGANAKKFGAVAIGSQTNALGESSLVVGGGTAAEDYSIAMAGGKALAKHSFAFGIDSQVAKDAKESIAIGRDSSAKQKLSLSIGHFAKSDGILNSVIGYDATGSGQGATVLGGYGESGENSTAIGLNAKALGNMSTVVGAFSDMKEEDMHATIFGANTHLVKAKAATAIGTWNNITDSNVSTALGYSNTITNSKQAILISAEGNSVNSENSIGIGSKIKMENAGNSIGMGGNTEINSVESVSIGIESKLKENASNSVIVGARSYIGEKTGSAGGSASGQVSEEKVNVGSYVEEAVLRPSAISKYAYSTVVGSQSKSFGNQNTVMGSGAEAHDTNSVTFGNVSIAKGHLSTSVGASASTDGKRAAAFGAVSEATAENALALGSYAKSRVEGGIALGAFSEANVEKGQWGYNSLTKKSMTQDELVTADMKADYETAKTELTALKNDEAAILSHLNKLLDEREKMTDKDQIKNIKKEISAKGDELILKREEISKKEAIINSYTNTWQSTAAAVSVGNVKKGITRQITDVAAGTKDTDAVNVAQLKQLSSFYMPMTQTVRLGSGGVVAKNGDYSDATTTHWDMALNQFRMDFAGGLKAEEKQDADGKKYTLVTLDKELIAKDNTFKGPKGDTGTGTGTTSPSMKGEKGDAGEPGPMGPVGPTGPQGNEGPMGPVGPQGPRGEKGEKGDKGDVGPQGPMGPAGPAGGTGGAVGPQGPQGKEGPRGPKGDTGAIGEKGDTGPQGPRGPQGPIGPVGPTGPQGRQGEKGDRGEAGATTISGRYDAATGKLVMTKTDNSTYEVDMKGMSSVMNTGLEKLSGRVDRIGATSAALSALRPLESEFNPHDKWDFAVGYGNYQGANALAMGAYYRPNKNMLLSLGGSIGGEEHIFNAGISLKIGEGVSGVSKAEMADQIISQKAEILELKSQLIAMEKRIEKLEQSHNAEK